MYEIDELDSLIKLTDVPQSDVGSPSPIVFSDEHRLVLAYWTTEAPHPTPNTLPLAVVRFHLPCFHLFGPPNDEALGGHPLYSRGLQSYSAFEVNKSSLVRTMERRNRVHMHHNPERFESRRHYIFTFHDSTFECVCESLATTIEHVAPRENDGRVFEIYKNTHS